MTDDIVIIGKVGAPYGVKGWSKIFSYTIPIENILEYQPWLMKQGNTWQVVPEIAGKVHNKVIVAKLPGAEDRDQAKAFTHQEIAIYRHQLPTLDDDEYYWSDLIGLKVIDCNEKPLGTVHQVTETGSNDVLIIKAEKDFAVPMIMREVIKEVNLKDGYIRVDWDPIY